MSMGGDTQKQEQQAGQQASSSMNAAGQAANQQIQQASQPSQTQQGMQTYYNQQAQQAPETLMQQGGPIAQALSQRVLQNAQNPGGEYDVASVNQAIGNPIWAGLKARGIAAPAGSTGGGVGTEQYMQQMVPYLAQAKQAQANTDISNAMQYGQSANALQQYYQGANTSLANTLAQQLQQGAEAGAGYQMQGAMGGAQAVLGQSNIAAQQQYQQQQALMNGLGSMGTNALGTILQPVGNQLGQNLSAALLSRAGATGAGAASGLTDAITGGAASASDAAAMLPFLMGL